MNVDANRLRLVGAGRAHSHGCTHAPHAPHAAVPTRTGRCTDERMCYWVRTPYWGHLKGDRLLGKDSSPSCDSSVEVLTRVLNVGLRLGEPETNAARCTRCQAAAARAGPERSSSAPDEGGHQRSSEVIRGNLGRRDPRAHLLWYSAAARLRNSRAQSLVSGDCNSYDSIHSITIVSALNASHELRANQG